MSRNESISFPKLSNLKPVLFGEERVGTWAVGSLQINRPQALNALNTECYEMIEPQILKWQSQKDIAAIILESTGDRAFCAGGDVKSLALTGKEHSQNKVLDFFTLEYGVDYLLHIYKKPVVALVDGICMGGGVGLMNGATLRVITERSSLAMPEVAIGFFPDVGATRFLAQLPEQAGLLMGLTVLRINGAEAVELKLADGLVNTQILRQVRADILRAGWSGRADQDRQLLRSGFHFASGPSSQFLDEWRIIYKKLDYENYASWEKSFLSYCPAGERWDEVKTRLKSGSPLSRQVFFRAYHTNKDLDWRDVFLSEWQIAIQFCKNPEFYEGVRAVLIDKDQKPKWQDLGGSTDMVNLILNGNEPNLLAKKFSELGI
jgi:enoyl-CoA hydratase/carnithine racemase